MLYEWDLDKNQRNQEKHGLSFEMAHLVFEGFHITQLDQRKEYGESRYCTMGTLGEYGRVVLVAHTIRDTKTRIISMRKANDREQKIFNRFLEEHHHEEKSIH